MTPPHDPSPKLRAAIVQWALAERVATEAAKLRDDALRTIDTQVVGDHEDYSFVFPNLRMTVLVRGPRQKWVSTLPGASGSKGAWARGPVYVVAAPFSAMMTPEEEARVSAGLEDSGG